MRSVEMRVRARACATAGVVAAAITLLGGCSSVEALKARMLPSSAAAPGAAASGASMTTAGKATSATPGTIGGAATAAAPAATDATPVDPAVQRAFDDANRALRAGRAADAERGYRALIQAHPELAGPHANLALIERHTGKLADAASELERAVALSPKQPLYLNQLGVSYRQLGQFNKARDAYERALALDSDYAAATLNLGILNDLYLGDATRAAELYQRYLALTPAGDPAVTKWIAELKNRKAPVAAIDRKEKT